MIEMRDLFWRDFHVLGIEIHVAHQHPGFLSFEHASHVPSKLEAGAR